ncbi:MAG: hypothetical protein ACYCOU_07335 [Sulfobacillus sp.]
MGGNRDDQAGGVGAVLILALMAGCAPPFMRGVASGNVAKVETELAHGADLNARDARGNTPLIVAALDGHNHNPLEAIDQVLR